MARLKIGVGFHSSVACACDGIGEYIHSLAVGGHTITAKCVDGTSSLVDFQNEIYAGASGVGIWRKATYSWGESDCPPYTGDPHIAAINYFREIDDTFPPELDRNLFFIEAINEVDKNESQWIGEFLYELAIMLLDSGYKFAGPGWSAGEPEREHWETPGMLKYLRLCAKHPESLAVTVHEYSLTQELVPEIPFLMGRMFLLNNICARNDIPLPSVFISEFGWEYNNAPIADDAVSQIKEMIMWYIQNVPNVKALHIWALDKSSNWGNLPNIVNTYMEPLVKMINETDWEEPETSTPPIAGENLINNWSFEDGWTDMPPAHGNLINQQPNGWLLAWAKIGETIRGFEVTGIPECVHKFQHQLPSHEWPGEANALILNGQVVYKMFASGAKWGGKLSQKIVGLDPFQSVELHVPVNVHFHDRPDEYDPEDTLLRIIANGRSVEFFVNKKNHKQWEILEIGANADASGNVLISIEISVKWEHPTDVFVDAVSLYVTDNSTEPPSPAKPKIVIYKLAQEHDKNVWRNVAGEAHDNYKRTITASTDDMVTMLLNGNDESYAVVFDPDYASQIEAINALVNKRLSFKTQYYTMHPDFFRYAPCDTKIVTQLFGANPEVYSKYGLPGHDGVDYAVRAGKPYYAVQDGIVSYAGDKMANGTGKSAYGWHVYIEHLVAENIFETLYAHAAPNLPVKTGDVIKAGDIVGYSGNTGNSTGYHLHFGLLWPMDTGNGYPVWTHGQPINPWPYLRDKNPPSETVVLDVLEYIYPGRFGPIYEVQHLSGPTETFQVQGTTETFYLIKNSQYETFHARMRNDVEYIWRSIDTSPGPAPDYAERPGEMRFYEQNEFLGMMSRWCKRYMEIGETFSNEGHRVQFYYKDTCAQSAANSGHAANVVSLIAHHAVLHFHDITVENVIEMQTNTNEFMFFAKGLGLVAWRSPWGKSEIIKIHDDRQNLDREQGCFTIQGP